MQIIQQHTNSCMALLPSSLNAVALNNNVPYRLIRLHLQEFILSRGK